jgi:TupA-like ATPgrasp
MKNVGSNAVSSLFLLLFVPPRAIVADLKSKLKAIAATFGIRGPQDQLKAKLSAKRAYWFETPDAPSEVKALAALASNKLLMRRYVRSLGLRLPEIYWEVGDVDAIDFASLPDRVVIKPHNGWDSDAVMLIDGERELLSGSAVPRGALRDFCRKTLASARFAREPRIIVEEFVRDYNPQFAIPRDFKVYVAGGKAWVVQVVDRNGPKFKRAFYTKEWTQFADPFNTINLPAPPIPAPPLLPKLISAAELMASDLGAFLRLDFYLTSDGPIFGEITWNPLGGFGFTRFGAHYLCRLMDRFPDKIRADLSSD